MEKLASNQADTVHIGAETKLLMRLVGCRSLPAAKRIVRELGHRHRYTWHPVGNRENNYGEAFENYRQTELDRAAQTVIHSISSEGRLEG